MVKLPYCNSFELQFHLLNTNHVISVVLGKWGWENKWNEEREVLGVGSIPVAILFSCQNMKIIALPCIT